MKQRVLRLTIILGALLAATAILHVRKPDSFQNPQFWAEDGTIFFSQAYQLGLKSHLEPYSGYFHEVPRLVASLAQLFPYRQTPAIYNFSAMAVMLYLVLMVFSPRLDLKLPILFGLMVVLVPLLGGTVFLNLTNLQWPLALVLLLVALQKPADSGASSAHDGFIIVLAGLTGPFILLVLPLVFLNWLRHRTVPTLVLTCLATVTAAIQAMAIVRNPTPQPPHSEHSAGAWIELFGRRLTGNLFLGHELPYSLDSSWLAVGGGLVLSCVIWRLCSVPEGRRLGIPMLYFGLAVVLLAFYKFRNAANLLVPPAAASRYFYVFFVIFSWCLLLLIIYDKRWFKAPAVVLLGMILHSSLISGFTSPPLRNYHWNKHAARIGVEEAPEIPINPKGWRIRLESIESER